MYEHFDENEDDPTPILQNDDRHHCYLIFKRDPEDMVTASIFHHLAQYPTRLGITTVHDGNWFLSSDQSIGGHQVTCSLPADLFAEVEPAQSFTPERIQRESANKPSQVQLVVTINEANLDDLELIIPRRGMWLPNQYASLCLEEGLSPVDVHTSCSETCPSCVFLPLDVFLSENVDPE